MDLKKVARVLGSAVAVSGVMLMEGCVGYRAPFAPPIGGAFSQVSAPLSTEYNK